MLLEFSGCCDVCVCVLDDDGARLPIADINRITHKPHSNTRTNSVVGDMCGEPFWNVIDKLAAGITTHIAQIVITTLFATR